MEQHNRSQALGEGLRAWLPDGLVALVLLAAGVCWRWSGMLGERLFSDNVYQYLNAQHWLDRLHGVLPGSASLSVGELLWPTSAPWQVHLGPAATWLYVPLVAGADSLQDAIERRLVVQALVVAVLYLALRLSLGRWPGRGWRWAEAWPSMLAALTAALALGFSGEPFGLMTHGDESLLAPDLVTLYVAALAAAMLSGRRGWLVAAFAVLPFAVMLHPYNACFVPGALLAAVVGWRSGGRRAVLAALGVGALCAVPELIQLGRMLGPQGHGQASELLVLAGSAFASPLDPLALSLVSFVELEPFPLGLLLLAAPLAVWWWRRRDPGGTPDEAPGPETRRTGIDVLTLSLLLAMVVFLGLGIGFDLLRPYHWRLVLPALALQLGLAVFLLARRTRAARPGRGRRAATLALASPAALLLLAGSLDALDHPSAPLRGDAVMHRWVAGAVQQDADQQARWIDAVVLGWDAQPRSWFFAPAVYLDQRLDGVPPERFRLDGLIYLMVNGSTAYTDAVRLALGWDRQALDGWPGVGAGGEPLPARGFAGVFLVGWYSVARDQTMLLVRCDDWRASQAWTRWLAAQVPDRQVHLMLDVSYYLPQTMPGFRPEQALRYVDPVLARCHAGDDAPCGGGPG